MCVCAYAYTYSVCVCACLCATGFGDQYTYRHTYNVLSFLYVCHTRMHVCTLHVCVDVFVEVRGQANHMCAADMIAWRTLSVSKAKTHVDIHADFCACLADVYASLCMHPSGPVHECIQSMHARAHAQLHVHVVGRFMYITTHVCIHAHRYAHGSYLVTFCM